MQNGFLFSGLLFIMMSCSIPGGSSSTAEKQKFAAQDRKIIQDINQVIMDMPAPSEIPQSLKKLNISYDPQLAQDLNRLSEYQSVDDKAALILGVYATDVAYLIAFDQVQESLRYLEGCQRLAESLGVSSSFDITTIKRYELNIDKKDSLVSLLNETLQDAQLMLSNSERLTMAALVITGAYIEGMHILATSIDSYPHKGLSVEERAIILEPLVQMILSQEKPLLDIIKLLNDIPRDPIISALLVEMMILEKLYQTDLEEIEKQLAVDNNDFHITPEMLLEVIYEIKRIRKKITE